MPRHRGGIFFGPVVRWVSVWVAAAGAKYERNPGASFAGSVQPLALTLALSPTLETRDLTRRSIVSRMPPAMTGPDANPILFFDGVCGLCNRVVDFVLRHDRRGVIRFAPLQGTTAQQRLPDRDRERLDTVVFIEDTRITRRSTAIVHLLSHLGGGWTAAAWLLWLIPWPLRDIGYRAVSKLRYRLFGRKETCRLPTPDERERFLD